jgi:hypothetical protein
MQEINAGDEVLACYVSVEDCQGITEREEAMRTLYCDICGFAELSGAPVPCVEAIEPNGLLRSTLIKWAELVAPKPLVVLFDEVDVLQREPIWIVNSLFKRAALRILDEDSTKTVTIEHIQEARQQMIDAQETHLDALAVRTEDPKVRKVMESLIFGEPNPILAAGEEFRVCLDLGLVALVRGAPTIANPIYREVIARQMTYATQLAIPKPEWRWRKPGRHVGYGPSAQGISGFPADAFRGVGGNSQLHRSVPLLAVNGFPVARGRRSRTPPDIALPRYVFVGVAVGGRRRGKLLPDRLRPPPVKPAWSERPRWTAEAA